MKTDQTAGINQAVHPPNGALDGNAVFAIICVYLFVVFYSFGWGPTPFILSSECAPNHVRSLIMAAALMTQWLFNFVIAVSKESVDIVGFTSDDLQKLTPIMLADISYGTFLLFGAACIIMGVYTIFFVPETKGVPLESIHLLFEGSIIKGCVQDTFPGTSRAKKLMAQVRTDDGASEDGDDVKKGGRVEQVERV